MRPGRPIFEDVPLRYWNNTRDIGLYIRQSEQYFEHWFQDIPIPRNGRVCGKIKIYVEFKTVSGTFRRQKFSPEEFSFGPNSNLSSKIRTHLRLIYLDILHYMNTRCVAINKIRHSRLSAVPHTRH